MITFTREALQIEKERDELINLRSYYAGALVPRFFLNGHSQIGGLPELQSARQLKARLSLLESPQALQHVKDSLVEAYRLEIEAAQLETQRELSDINDTSQPQFSPRIDRFNVDSYKKGQLPTTMSRDSPWVIAQELRRDTYAKWAQLLREHGIDPAKEGFTSLVQE
ncbi:MAG: hypothetical protein Q8O40_16870 [Chloroflexota bacterium]|nr:hypothetical protein [Chloroflexota bacterium]